MAPSDRTLLYRKFTERFRPIGRGCRIVRVTHAEIDEAESAIGCKLPLSYRTFVTEMGAGEIDASFHALLRVAEIWPPKLIVRQLKEAWCAPIPSFLNEGTALVSDIAWKYLTPFASEESHGFWFCFPRAVDRPDDAPVYFFNHDGGEIECVADGFDDMLRRILNGGPAT